MRLSEVQPHPPCNVKCCKCGVTLLTSANRVWADLDGKPFHAYYCALCVPLEDGKSFHETHGERPGGSQHEE